MNHVAGVIISVKIDAKKKIDAQKAARAKAEAEVAKLKEQVTELQVIYVFLKQNISLFF